jgi:hypothetical protein
MDSSANVAEIVHFALPEIEDAPNVKLSTVSEKSQPELLPEMVAGRRCPDTSSKVIHQRGKRPRPSQSIVRANTNENDILRVGCFGDDIPDAQNLADDPADFHGNAGAA